MAKNNNPGRILKGTKSQPTLKGASGVWTLDEALQAHRANSWPQPNLYQPVANSLRISAAKTAYMTHIGPRGGTSTTWTWSGWVKPTMYDNSTYNNVLFYAEDPAGNISMVSFEQSPNSPAYRIYVYHNGQNNETTQVFRDPSAWYHIVAVADTTNNTSSDRLRLYVNGSRVTSFAATATITQGANGGSGRPGTTYWIGKQGASLPRYGDSYLAEVNFVDGYALQPTLFGQFDSNNTWVPVAYTGSYGTNGFYLPFTNATTSQTLGYDASLNGAATYGADQDPYRGSVALHLTGNGPAGGQNNSFADSGPNNLAFTRNGTTTQGSFSPFPFNTNAPYNPAVNGASAYFNGTTDYIYTASNALFNVGSNNVTVEAWVYLTAFNQGASPYISTIWSLDGSGTNNTFFYVYRTGSIAVGINGVNEIASATGVITLNTWFHTAVVRNGSTTTVYVNGVSVASNITAVWANTGSRPFYVGSNPQSAYYYLTGYIASVRFLMNAVVYTSAFTPTMRPFGTLTNNLVLFSEDFNNYRWNANTNVTVSAGAAVAPDGTPSGALVSCTSTAASYIRQDTLTAMGTSTAYTMSAYVKVATSSIATLSDGFGTGANVTYNLATQTQTAINAAAGSNASSTLTSVGNGWYRITLTFTTQASNNYNIGTRVDPGRTYGGTGNVGDSIYVWGLQLDLGSTANNYTPTPANYSTAPALLLNFANAAVADSCGGNNVITVNSSTISSASKYGSGALSFNGVTDYMLVPPNPAMAFGTGAFTIEFWHYSPTIGSNTCLIDMQNGMMIRQNSNNSLLTYSRATGTQLVVTPNNTLMPNVWSHVAVTRLGTTMTVWINGQNQGQWSLNDSLTQTANTYIGAFNNNQVAPQTFTGQLDDIRITAGIARYQAAFTPPARALPETGGKSFVTQNVNAGVVKQFTTVGTTSWTAPTDVTQVEVLVVAGGAGGGTSGANYCGGGGAGGLIYNNSYPVTPGQTYTVTVGAGGAAQANGSNSTFGPLTTIGGGAGASAYATAGSSGGSGGGGGPINGSGGNGTAGQGFAGGVASSANQGGQDSGAGGGGGAGGIGGPGYQSGTGPFSNSPNGGGQGLNFGISGIPKWYAAGGTGSGYYYGGDTGTNGIGGSTPGSGGSSAVINGTANTGAGGGGGRSGTGGSGGSGIVIVRYTTTAVGNTSDATTDNLVDSPTLYGHDYGNGGEVVGNYATLNPLVLTGGATLSNGNLTITGVTAYRTTPATIAMTSGKWYWENKLLTYTGSDIHVGVCLGNFTSFQGTWVLSTAFGWGYTCQGGYGYTNNTLKNISSSARSTGDTIGIAFDADAGNLYAYVNGVVVNGGSPIYTGLTSGPYFPFVTTGDSNTNVACNFGQRAWAYSPPAGFSALTLKNFSRPVIGSAAATPNQYFDAVTYTGTGSAQTITLPGAFQPDLVWVKSRANPGTHQNLLHDSVRGITTWLISNSAGAEATDGTSFSSFNSNGFTLGTGGNGHNISAETYVAWCWRANGTAVSNTAGSITSQVSANTTSGFSIVTYTGAGAGVASTVGHGLTTAPSFIIAKVRSTTNGWLVYHSSIGATYSGILSGTNAFAVQTDWNNTAPTTSVFSITGGNNNIASATYVAYCWSEVPGFSKFGSWTNNNNNDGTFVYLGFKPAFVMLKNTDNTETWYITDSKRHTYNVAAGADTTFLVPNASSAEGAGNATTATVDLLSNGFKIRTTNPASGEISFGTRNYIYAAFAEKPFGNTNGTAR